MFVLPSVHVYVHLGVLLQVQRVRVDQVSPHTRGMCVYVCTCVHVCSMVHSWRSENG